MAVCPCVTAGAITSAIVGGWSGTFFVVTTMKSNGLLSCPDIVRVTALISVIEQDESYRMSQGSLTVTGSPASHLAMLNGSYEKSVLINGFIVGPQHRCNVGMRADFKVVGAHCANAAAADKEDLSFCRISHVVCAA